MPALGLSQRLQIASAYFRPLTTTRCPACESGDVTPIEVLAISGRVEGRRAVFATGCEACGLVFINPMPAHEALDSLYSATGTWAMTHDAGDETPDAPPHPRYLRHLFSPIRDHLDVMQPPAGATVLDIGCGAGELLDAFKALGWRTCGLDPADRRAFPAHEEVDALPEAPAFTAIVLHHVLEHVDSPLAMLRRVHAALQDGGAVLVSVPRLDALPQHRDLHYCLSARPHIVAYTRDCMTTLLALAGLDPVVVDAGEKPSKRSLKRLQMLGVKRAARSAPPRAPLDQARRAFGQYRALEATRWFERWGPVRLRGALREIDREGRRGQKPTAR